MGWFANLVFGKAKNIEGPIPPDHSAWGVEQKGVPNVAEQEVRPQEHDETPPVLQCIRVEPHLSSAGDHLELWLCMQNMSIGEVEITRFDCLGQSVEPSRFLRAGQNQEFRVYSGPVLHNDDRQKALMTCKSINSGEYYQAEYMIKYKYSQHGGEDQCLPYELDLLQTNKIT